MSAESTRVPGYLRKMQKLVLGVTHFDQLIQMLPVEGEVPDPRNQHYTVTVGPPGKTRAYAGLCQHTTKGLVFKLGCDEQGYPAAGDYGSRALACTIMKRYIVDEFMMTARVDPERIRNVSPDGKYQVISAETDKSYPVRMEVAYEKGKGYEIDLELPVGTTKVYMRRGARDLDVFTPAIQAVDTEELWHKRAAMGLTLVQERLMTEIPEGLSFCDTKDKARALLCLMGSYCGLEVSRPTGEFLMKFTEPVGTQELKFKKMMQVMHVLEGLTVEKVIEEAKPKLAVAETPELLESSMDLV